MNWELISVIMCQVALAGMLGLFCAFGIAMLHDGIKEERLDDTICGSFVLLTGLAMLALGSIWLWTTVSY